MGNLSFVLFLQESRILLFSLVLVFFTNKLAGIPFRRLNILIKILLVLGIQIIILQALLYHHGAVVGKFLGLKVYMGGILLGIHSFLILVNLAMFSLHTMDLGRPDIASVIHLPSRYAVLVGSLRFLPIMEKILPQSMKANSQEG